MNQERFNELSVVMKLQMGTPLFSLGNWVFVLGSFSSVKNFKSPSLRDEFGQLWLVE
jgi:hypothetical protein